MKLDKKEIKMFRLLLEAFDETTKVLDLWHAFTEEEKKEFRRLNAEAKTDVKLWLKENGYEG